MAGSATGYQSYRQVDVETASQGKLIVMLFNGAIQRAEEAKRQLDKGKIEGVHNNLVRAQEIIAELRGALDMKAGGDIAANLDRIYEYYQHLLIMGNLRKDAGPIDECVAGMKSMRDTWDEAFSQLVKSQPPPTATLNPHGAAALNLQG